MRCAPLSRIAAPAAPAATRAYSPSAARAAPSGIAPRSSAWRSSIAASAAGSATLARTHRGSPWRSVALAVHGRLHGTELRPWALQPASGVSTFNRLYMALGEQEGVGGLLHIASLGADGSEVMQEDIDAFLQRSDAFFDGVFHTVNQFAIVAALVFTISVPLAVYNLDGIETFGTRDAALGGDGSPAWYRAWHGPRAQHACHWASCCLISLSVYCSWEAISRCFMLIPTYSLYMPDMEARLRFFMLHHDQIMCCLLYTSPSPRD